MREIEICKKHLNPGGPNNYEIVYYITVDEVTENEGVVFENYGAGIRIENGEEDRLRGITMDLKKIELILELLAKGTVTPIGLRDVLYDLLEVIV